MTNDWFETWRLGAQTIQDALRHAVKNLQSECKSMLEQFDEAEPSFFGVRQAESGRVFLGAILARGCSSVFFPTNFHGGSKWFSRADLQGVHGAAAVLIVGLESVSALLGASKDLPRLKKGLEDVSCTKKIWVGSHIILMTDRRTVRTVFLHKPFEDVCHLLDTGLELPRIRVPAEHGLMRNRQALLGAPSSLVPSLRSSSKCHQTVMAGVW